MLGPTVEEDRALVRSLVEACLATAGVDYLGRHVDPALAGSEPEPAAAADDNEDGPFTAEGAASLDFQPMKLDVPIRNVSIWCKEFSHYALGMYTADRILRIGKAEAVDLVRKVGCLDGSITETMFKAITGAQKAFESLGKLLDTAACRYAIAISTVSVEQLAETEA